MQQPAEEKVYFSFFHSTLCAEIHEYVDVINAYDISYITDIHGIVRRPHIHISIIIPRFSRFTWTFRIALQYLPQINRIDDDYDLRQTWRVLYRRRMKSTNQVLFA